MKRYASLDFLRGFAILMMITLHMVMHVLDVDTLMENANDGPLLNLVALIVLPFLGGQAGFFLLVSAIGNMVSMHKFLEGGNSPKQLAIRQVVGGIILLFFAFLVEGTIGYLGSFGQWLKNILVYNIENKTYPYFLYRFNFFETIHTIAWCIIVNGLIQALLSRKGNWKNISKMIKTYILLSVIVLALTTFVWLGVAEIVPGFPYAKNEISTNSVMEPVLGVDPFWRVLLAMVLNPLAGRHEPLFPYVVVSFIGSIIGIVICQPKEKIPPHFVKKILVVALFMFIIGSIGVIVMVLMVMMGDGGFDGAIDLYRNITHHRDWFPDHPSHPAPSVTGWLWQFLSLTGFGLMGTMITIYLVEFRGKGNKFAKKTKFVRRFGFIAFTNYSQQYIFFIVFLFTSIIFTQTRLLPGPTFPPDSTFLPGTPYQQLGWGGLFITLLLTLAVYHILMIAWETVGYFGSLEWAIATMGAYLNPSKRNKNPEKKWWEKGKLQVDGAFYNVGWLETLKIDNCDSLEYESRMLSILASISVFSIFFMPFSLVTLSIGLKTKKLYGSNKKLKRAIILSTIGTVLTVLFFGVCFLSPTMLNFELPL